MNSKKFKGEKTLFILNKIGDGVEDMSEIFIAFLNAGYGASYSKINYEKEKISVRKLEYEEKMAAQNRFNSLVRYLDNQDLINKDKKGILRTTKRGKKRRQELKERKENKSLPYADYTKEDFAGTVIVAFDVPEKDRYKRNWLRAALAGLGFELIQRSLFIGKTKIPAEFLEDLKDLNILNKVAIFEVSGEGVFERVVEG